MTVEEVAKIICEHWPKPPDGCAMLCMDRLGSIPKDGCRHRMEVHGKMAKAILAEVYIPEPGPMTGNEEP